MSALAKRLKTYDRTLAVAAGVLALAGFVLSLAASPAATARTGYDEAFHFSLRQGAYTLAAIGVFAGAASLSAKGVRRVSLLIYMLCIALMVLVLFVGAETKGAQRWLHVGEFSLQPSEFLKPALIVLAAWMLAERSKTPAFPGLPIAGALYALAAALLLKQPDVGQTALIGVTLTAMLFVSGVSWIWIVGVAAAGAALLLGLYVVDPHVTARVNAFFDAGDAQPFQVARALDAIRNGGALGRGPGEGVFKLSLPDAQGDFIYSVAAEEFGLLASAGLIALYALIGWRGLSRAQRLADPFAQLAASGLIVMFCLQAMIHIAVNLDLIPAKGMTLPLVSYGGSSMFGSAITLGFALALLRWRQGAYIYERQRG